MNEDSETQQVVSSPSADYDRVRAITPESPCPYLPNLQSRNEAYRVDHLDGQVYERLMAMGFRRSGHVVYRPVCRSCHKCVQLRVPISSFRLTRSMRRVWKGNQDVRVEVGAPRESDEKYVLFTHYLERMHDDLMDRSYDCFRRFLYETPTDTQEIVYRVGQRIVGVSIVDRCPGGLSSVYMFFDPHESRRSLGTYSVLWEIDYCRQRAMRYYYLGYYVAGCPTMDYKARFRPNEILVGDDCWQTLRE